jgi:hypothetical protein
MDMKKELTQIKNKTRKQEHPTNAYEDTYDRL